MNFFTNFDFKNLYENVFKDKNEKCSLSRNRVSHKIDFIDIWPRNGHATSVGVKLRLKTDSPFLYTWIEMLLWICSESDL